SENVASRRVTVCSSHPNRYFVKLGSCDNTVAPKNQNHEMPNMERSTVRLALAILYKRMVSGNGFQHILRSGAPAWARGINKLVTQPSRAIRIKELVTK